MPTDAIKMLTSDSAEKAKTTGTHKPAQLSVETKFRLMMGLTRMISSSLDLDAVLNLIIDTARSFIHYDSAEIFIIDERFDKQRRIKAHTSRGFDLEHKGHCLQMKVGEGIVGWVVKTGFGIIVPDVSMDPRYIAGREQTKSEMAVPIRANGDVIGAFNIECDDLGAYTKLDLEMLMFFANQAAISIEKAILHKALLEKERLDAELAVARSVQQSLLPKIDPVFSHYEMAGFNHPSKEVGGDYFDFIQVGDNRLGVVIADVSGKGVPAALVMATFRSSLRGQLCSECPVGGVFHQLNLMLRDSNMADQYVTAFYLDLYRDSHDFTYLNAGHNPPLLLKKDGSWEMLDRSNTVLGLLPWKKYSEYRHRAESGDLILLYTDGATEAYNGKEEFGVSRFAEAGHKHRDLPVKELVKAVYKEVRDFSNSPLQDDCTIIAVKVN